MRVLFFPSLLISFILLTTGCAQRLDEVEERMDSIQKRTAALEAKTGSPIGSDRELLEGQKIADVRSQVAALRNDITVLQGKAEALEYDNKNMANTIDSLTRELDALKSKASAAGPAVALSQSSDLSDAESDFNLALRAHQDGAYDKAQKLFEAFLNKYPKNPLTDRALFWEGEGYMNQKQYKKAIVKFQDLIEKYPKSEKRCEAIDRQITALKELDMKKEAQAFIQVKKSECSSKK